MKKLCTLAISIVLIAIALYGCSTEETVAPAEPALTYQNIADILNDQSITFDPIKKPTSELPSIQLVKDYSDAAQDAIKDNYTFAGLTQFRESEPGVLWGFTVSWLEPFYPGSPENYCHVYVDRHFDLDEDAYIIDPFMEAIEPVEIQHVTALEGSLPILGSQFYSDRYQIYNYQFVYQTESGETRIAQLGKFRMSF